MAKKPENAEIEKIETAQTPETPDTAQTPETPETPDTAKTAPAEEEREDIYIERAHSGDESSLLVSINGKNFLLPKGETSRVPKYVADEIRRSQKAQNIYDRRSREMIEASK